MSNKKLKKLESILENLGTVLVAYSGGVDSTFLLKTALSVLSKKRVLAVTAKSETFPHRESLLARKIAKRLGSSYKVIYTKELNVKNFKKNPIDRCYFCKKELFKKLKAMAKKESLYNVIDGSNFDDLFDWRAGSIAAKELGVRSPLAEAGMHKKDIRTLSRKFNLPTWNKPSFACLASRIPYNSRITKSKLGMIDEAENILLDLGFSQARVRHYDLLARIEVFPGDLAKILNSRKTILRNFKKLGFKYITLDLEGYRTGSMNEAIALKR